MRIAIVDTYYPDFLATLPRTIHNYEMGLAATLAQGFGTGDFYSSNFRRLGWAADDIIANYRPLQEYWARTRGVPPSLSMQEIAMEQIANLGPDFVFMQDLSFFSPRQLHKLRENSWVVGQCSCPLPLAENIREMDMIFTSFPHYPSIFARMGVKAHFIPLAFEPSVLEKCNHYTSRPIDTAFIGGVGQHWDSTPLLESVAHLSGTRIYGYGYNNYDFGQSRSLIMQRYIGQVWGMGMYKILSQSKIGLNRHGRIAAGYSNNMRMFEASGCGALLVTEESANIEGYFSKDEVVTYRDAADAVAKIQYYLNHWDEGSQIAKRGQAKTLKYHNYADRIGRIINHLQEL